MKFKKIFQKAAAVVMAAVTVFSVLPATTAFAAVGDVGTISFSHTYDGNGNAMRYNSSANINGYCTGITQNVDDLLQSHTARTMLANSEFIIMLNQAYPEYCRELHTPQKQNDHTR